VAYERVKPTYVWQFCVIILHIFLSSRFVETKHSGSAVNGFDHGNESRWRLSPRFFSGLPSEPCALESTQPLKMSTRDFSWSKGGRCVRLTTYHPCSAECQLFRGLNLPGTLGPPRPIVGDFYLFTFS